jgi:hypothetical protein
MILDVTAIRTFLVAAPRPAKIQVTSIDGDKTEIQTPKGPGVSWASVARSIETIDPVSIELFDETGTLIRAQRLDGLGKDSGPVVGGVLPDILARDAESARLALFAQLISQAYRFSVETAFTKMVEIFERLDARQDRVEKRLEHAEAQYRRVMAERVDAALDEAEATAREAEESKADPAGALLQTFIGGVTQGAAAAPNGGGNGKAAKP